MWRWIRAILCTILGSTTRCDLVSTIVLVANYEYDFELRLFFVSGKSERVGRIMGRWRGKIDRQNRVFRRVKIWTTGFGLFHSEEAFGFRELSSKFRRNSQVPTEMISSKVIDRCLREKLSGRGKYQPQIQFLEGGHWEGNQLDSFLTYRFQRLVA